MRRASSSPKIRSARRQTAGFDAMSMRLYGTMSDQSAKVSERRSLGTMKSYRPGDDDTRHVSTAGSGPGKW